MFRNTARRRGAGRIFTDRALRYAAGTKNYFEGTNAISRTVPVYADTIQTSGTTTTIRVDPPQVDCAEIIEIYNTVKQQMEAIRDVFSSKYKPVATVISELKAL